MKSRAGLIYLFLVVVLAIALFGFFINKNHKKVESEPKMKTIEISLEKQEDTVEFQIFLTEKGALSLVKIIENKSENELVTTQIRVDISKPTLICIRASNEVSFSEMVFFPINIPPSDLKLRIVHDIDEEEYVIPIDSKSGYILSKPRDVGWGVALYYETTWYSRKITHL